MSTAGDQKVLTVVKRNTQTPVQQIRNSIQEAGVSLSETTLQSTEDFMNKNTKATP